MKTKIIFIILNIILLLVAFISIREQIFLKIDDYFTSLFFKNFTNKKEPYGSNKIALIKIDKKFFDKEGVTPSTFHRGYYAKLLEKLQNYGVKNVVFDVYFTDLKYSNIKKNKIEKIYNKSIKYFDKKFQKQIKENVILGGLPIGNGEKLILPSSNLIKNKPWIGYVKSHINKNNINDGVYPYGVFSGKKYLTLSYAAYFNRLYIEGKINKKINIKIKESNSLFKNKILKIETSNSKYNKEIPLSKDKNGDYIFTPLFFSKSPLISFSIYDIINDEDNIYAEKLKNKTVFIGNTDESLNDVKLSYVGIIPGVMYHINNFLSLSSGFFMYNLPYITSFLIILFIYILGYFFVVIFKAEKLSIILFVIITIILLVFSYLSFQNGIIFPIGTAIIFLLLKLILDIFHVLWINEEKKEFLSNIFDKYVGKKIRESKKTMKDIGNTERKDIALMFSDIASFTNISEKLSAEEVGKMLNIYFEMIGPYIDKSKGYIDKYIGDAIMAYWEDIKSTDQIAKAIIDIQRIHPEIRKNVLEKVGKDIDLQTRIGLHFGEAIVGDVGDINGKIQPTALGDNVNLASRLEGINKYYNTNIIMSESFYNLIKNKDIFATRLLDKITVKGKSEPVKIYQLLTYKANEVNKDLKIYLKEYEQAIIFYFEGKFEDSIKILNQLKISNRGKEDKVIDIFIERLKYLIENKPENWDGVWRFKTK